MPYAKKPEHTTVLYRPVPNVYCRGTALEQRRRSFPPSPSSVPSDCTLSKSGWVSPFSFVRTAAVSVTYMTSNAVPCVAGCVSRRLVKPEPDSRNTRETAMKRISTDLACLLVCSNHHGRVARITTTAPWRLFYRRSGSLWRLCGWEPLFLAPL